jgi:large subunit ribosomal protein L35
VTGGGKVIHQQANLGHLFESKPSTRTRRLAADVETSGSDLKRVNRLLGR